MMTLHKLPAHELAEKIANGAVSSKETTEHFIDRIDRHNPAVNAIIDTCFDAALKEAEAADAARAKGDIKGPLHGLPMTIKDLFEVEGLTCDAGFREFKGPCLNAGFSSGGAPKSGGRDYYRQEQCAARRWRYSDL
jgi:Asp-tRNA(Asn)/Glu-tRNA(Gln) amidotransferase A subunit family amidase